MIAKFRIKLSVGLSWLAMRLAPREIRPILSAYAGFVSNFPEELASGRQGGVVIVPWAISEDGLKESRRVAEAASNACCAVRASIAHEKMVLEDTKELLEQEEN